ncbi:unnamed protein product [Arctia plantaginis]|uniref:Uncharacterized protein n=1 Tax=Arctia plantaginis TaxID=874455 RepID=A0A8S0ZPM0_ARCPL|nr:unnamed protein product [Arctia plantaginis]CAB3234839.1 unnamed protein product [Arctia plantaginis]
MSLSELSNAINSKAYPQLQQYFERAINELMDNLIKGRDNFSQKVFLSPSGRDRWTIEELSNEIKVVQDSNVNDDRRNAIFQAYGIYQQKAESGIVLKDIQVVTPAMDISVWTYKDLTAARGNANIEPELLQHIDNALAEIEKDTSGMVTRVGLLPHEPFF